MHEDVDDAFVDPDYNDDERKYVNDYNEVVTRYLHLSR